MQLCSFCGDKVQKQINDEYKNYHIRYSNTCLKTAEKNNESRNKEGFTLFLENNVFSDIRSDGTHTQLFCIR